MISRQLRILTGYLVLAAMTPVARAAEHAEEGSPNIFHGSLGQAFWTLLIFLLVVVVLGKFAWGPLLAALQKREAFIRDSLASAKRDREAAEARLKEYEQRIAKAAEEAGAIVEEGRRNGETLKRKIEEEARASADVTIERAKREITIAKETALKEFYDRSASLGTAIAGNLLKRQITPEDQRRLVEDALAELGNGVGTAQASRL